MNSIIDLKKYKIQSDNYLKTININNENKKKPNHKTNDTFLNKYKFN